MLEKNSSRNFWEGLLYEHRFKIIFVLIGISLIGLGIFFFKNSFFTSSEVEVLSSADEKVDEGEIIIEVAGAVQRPGVYKLPAGSRIEEAIVSAGGISGDADQEWMAKFLNKAAKIGDGQKLYIKHLGEESANIQAISSTTQGLSTNTGGDLSSSVSGFININTASQKELEALWGIGLVTAQNIIEQRPYSTIEELLEKKIIKSNVYERNKDKLTVN